MGPLTIQNPHFMEMSVPVSIAGSCSPIIGIIGYDFFRRCVIEMKSAPSKSKSTSLESNFSLKIFELCSLDQKEVFEDVNWIPIRMVGASKNALRKIGCRLLICRTFMFNFLQMELMCTKAFL